MKSQMYDSCFRSFRSFSDRLCIIRSQFRHWRQSGVLSSVIPVSHWSKRSSTRLLLIHRFRSLDSNSCDCLGLDVAVVHSRAVLEHGLFRGHNCRFVNAFPRIRSGLTRSCFASASGLYALGFGLMGLIPAPKVYRRS